MGTWSASSICCFVFRAIGCCLFACLIGLYVCFFVRSFVCLFDCVLGSSLHVSFSFLLFCDWFGLREPICHHFGSHVVHFRVIFSMFFKAIFALICWWFLDWFLMHFGKCFRWSLDPFLDSLNLCFLTTVPFVSSVLPCKIVSFFKICGYFFRSDFCVDFWKYFGCIFSNHFGHPLNTKCRQKNGQKSMRNMTHPGPLLGPQVGR